MIQDKQAHAPKTQLRPVRKRIRLVRDEPFVIQPGTVRAGKVNDLESSPRPADHRMPPRNSHLIASQFREVKQGDIGGILIVLAAKTSSFSKYK